MTSALVLCADGSEEMETVIAVDILRRAGIQVTLAAVQSVPQVTCSRQVVLLADSTLDQIRDPVGAFDCLVLPGGLGGAKTFASHPRVLELLREYSHADGKWTAVMCASPIALQAAQAHTGKTLTSHPSIKDQLASFAYSEDRVVVDGNLITSR
ncbi:Protein deglycase DJ-1zDJ-1 [Kappamyces sp. JEL0680]|nr:Protein deglycase DJ-1zDJ-1 [Kappamyces sp. JEL0680]